MEANSIVVIILLCWLACAPLAGIVGVRKGELWAAALSGLIFGPLGIVFAILSRGSRVSCPFCKESIHEEATVCPHCRQTLPQRPVAASTNLDL